MSPTATLSPVRLIAAFVIAPFVCFPIRDILSAFNPYFLLLPHGIMLFFGIPFIVMSHRHGRTSLRQYLNGGYYAAALVTACYFIYFAFIANPAIGYVASFFTLLIAVIPALAAAALSWRIINKSSRIELTIFGGLFLVWGAFGVADYYKNGEAYRIRSRVSKEINWNISKEISLAKVGGVDWDYVCLAGYEARGIDTANGLWIAQRELKNLNIDFSEFAVADETYNEFPESALSGLVFVNTSRRILVAISLNNHHQVFPSGDICSKAENASLRNKNFIGKM